MNAVPAYILAGGRSSRFGRDKARAMIGQRPMLSHVASMIETCSSSVTVVADRAHKYEDLGFRTIADLSPHRGPLAGLQTALTDLPNGSIWLLLCPCDAVVIRPEWLRRLLDARGTDRDAIAFRSEHWQPMPALYARTSLTWVTRQLVGGQWSMQRLLSDLRVASLSLPSDWPECWQVNTQADLARYDRRVRRTSTKRRPT